jgi:hypothetical protein
MSDPVIPSKDPANGNSMSGTLREVFRKMLQRTDGQLPAKVLGYNRVTNRAIVQPFINIVSTAGAQTVRAQIASVPVLALGGGGFCINFPLVNGDTGWIEASDRDISLFLQQFENVRPNTFRLHSFEDSRFIPDAFKQYSFDAGDDAAAMVIQSYDGTVKIALAPGIITVLADQNVINSQVTLNGSLRVSGHVLVGTGYSGTFSTPDGQTVTVLNGIIVDVL